MLEKITATSKNDVDVFVNSFMNRAKGWSVMQPDYFNMSFPAQFVLVAEPRISLATLHFLKDA